MVANRPRAIRLAAYANMTLGAFALLSVLLARDRLMALWLTGFIGIGLLLWGGVAAWAASSGRLGGTKLLAMFMAILGIVLAGSSFIMFDGGPYRPVSLALGALVFVVSFLDAIVSPDDDRRSSFEPRRPDDAARPPTL